MTDLDINARHLLELPRLPPCRLSHNKLGPEGAKALAPALAANASLTKLNLSGNMISGIGGEHSDGSGALRGSFSVEGIQAIANALSKSKTIQSVDLSNNALAGLNLSGHGTFHAEGVEAIAGALHVSASLTVLILKDNGLGPQGAKHLSDALKVNKSITELDISNGRGSSSGDIKAEGAKYIAEALLVNASLTSVWTPAYEPKCPLHCS